MIDCNKYVEEINSTFRNVHNVNLTPEIWQRAVSEMLQAKVLDIDLKGRLDRLTTKELVEIKQYISNLTKPMNQSSTETPRPRGRPRKDLSR